MMAIKGDTASDWLTDRVIDVASQLNLLHLMARFQVTTPFIQVVLGDPEEAGSG